MEKYSIVRVLGEGAFGKVLLAQNKEDGNTKVAVKEIKKGFKNWDGMHVDQTLNNRLLKSYCYHHYT